MLFLCEITALVKRDEKNCPSQSGLKFHMQNKKNLPPIFYFLTILYRNDKTGRCFSVRSLTEGEILRTELCDPNDPLQQWDCSTTNAFQLVLKDTDLAPTTAYRVSILLFLKGSSNLEHWHKLVMFR